jgi:glycosyltransferase involved in cell wall biosynthesis
MDKSRKIILFGAGGVGSKAIYFFGSRNVYCFADNNSAKQLHCGKKIISVQELIKIHSKYDVIVSANSPANTEISRQLQSLGIVCSDYNDIYREYEMNERVPNPRIAKLKDAFIREKCFLIGNGPSLRFEDLEMLHTLRIKSIACNFINKAFDKTIWRPDFFCVIEISAILTNLDFIKTFPLEAKFIRDLSDTEYGEVTDADQHEDICLYKYGGCPWIFSDDPSKIVYDAHTVMFPMLQFALYMGFSDVYLLGVDNTMPPSVHTSTFIQSASHFYKEEPKELERRKKIMKPHTYSDDWDTYQFNINKGYALARAYAENKGVKIMNATRGGKLEVFERVDIDELFKTLRVGSIASIATHSICKKSGFYETVNVLISIIVPVYNVQEYLRKCVDSLLDQDFDDYEIVLVNDGSTDAGADICREYAQTHARVSLIEQENKGLSAARNTGIRNARGQYLLFVDSDDYVERSLCREMHDVIKNNDVDIVLFDVYFLRKNGLSIYRQCDDDRFLERNLSGTEFFLWFVRNFSSMAAWGKLCAKRLFTESEISYPEGFIYEDMMTTPKLFIRSKGVYIKKNAPLYYYQERDESISRPPTEDMAKTTEALSFAVLSCVNDVLEATRDNAAFCDEDRVAFLKLSIDRLFESSRFFQYQQSNIDINSDLEHIFFGTGRSTCDFLHEYRDKIRLIYFVDKNVSKQGKFFFGAKVLAPKQLKEVYDSKRHQIVLTSSCCFSEIACQLIDEGIIRTIAEIFPNRGDNETERALIHGFEQLKQTLDRFDYGGQNE